MPCGPLSVFGGRIFSQSVPATPDGGGKRIREAHHLRKLGSGGQRIKSHSICRRRAGDHSGPSAIRAGRDCGLMFRCAPVQINCGIRQPPCSVWLALCTRPWRRPAFGWLGRPVGKPKLFLEASDPGAFSRSFGEWAWCLGAPSGEDDHPRNLGHPRAVIKA